MKILPLKNVENLEIAISDATQMLEGLPKIIVYYGPSGYGKSTAGRYLAEKNKNYLYIELGADYAVRDFLDDLLERFNISIKAKTIHKKTRAVIDYLKQNKKILIIDEFDFFVNKKRAVEIVRTIHDKANIPIVVIGEEKLPINLEAIERFHNRIINFVKVNPLRLEDVKLLATSMVYKEDKNKNKQIIPISEDLLNNVLMTSRGTARRVCVNLETIRKEAILKDYQKVGIQEWKNKAFYTGSTPKPRKLQG